MRRDRLILVIAALMLVTVMIAAGCGKKGDPIPPRTKPLPVISDLSVGSVPSGIELRWSVSGTGDVIGSFKIGRSERAPEGGACPGCPQEYQPIGALNVRQERLPVGGKRDLSYIDGDVKEGHYYSYRIVFCASNGFCGGASNEAGLLHKDR